MEDGADILKSLASNTSYVRVGSCVDVESVYGIIPANFKRELSFSEG